MGGALNGGALSCDLTPNGVDDTYFGPAGNDWPLQGYMGGWFQMKQLTAGNVLQIIGYDLDVGSIARQRPLHLGIVLLRQQSGPLVDRLMVMAADDRRRRE